MAGEALAGCPRIICDRNRDASRVLYQMHRAMRGGSARKRTVERAMMTLYSWFQSRVPTQRNPDNPSASAGAAARWKSVILSRSEPAEAFVKGSTLHLHPPGVIYRVRGKMNGRIKRVNVAGRWREQRRSTYDSRLRSASSLMTFESSRARPTTLAKHNYHVVLPRRRRIKDRCAKNFSRLRWHYVYGYSSRQVYTKRKLIKNVGQ